MYKDFYRCHPEQRKGEIYLFQTDEELLNDLCFEGLRVGNQALDGYYPLFIKTKEAIKILRDKEVDSEAKKVLLKKIVYQSIELKVRRWREKIINKVVKVKELIKIKLKFKEA